MSELVLAVCVCCYFVSNIYQNKFSTTLKNRLYPMNCFQMLWMGIAIALFATFELLTDGFSFSATTISYGLVAGVVALLGSICLLVAMSKGPLSLTILIFSMYVVLPPVLAMIFLSEKATVCQIIGIVLILIVIIMSNYNKDDSGKKYSRVWWLLCIGSVVFTGLNSYMSKLHQTKLPGQEEREYAIVSYGVGICLSLIFAMISKRKEAGKEKYEFRAKTFLLPAIVVAVTQGGANLCNLYNASRLPAIVLFPVTQLSTLLITMLYGIIFLRERLSRLSIVCFALGASAIVLMNF